MSTDCEPSWPALNAALDDVDFGRSLTPDTEARDLTIPKYRIARLEGIHCSLGDIRHPPLAKSSEKNPRIF
jgi:hypothetical protein